MISIRHSEEKKMERWKQLQRNLEAVAARRETRIAELKRRSDLNTSVSSGSSDVIIINNNNVNAEAEAYVEAKEAADVRVIDGDDGDDDDVVAIVDKDVAAANHDDDDANPVQLTVPSLVSTSLTSSLPVKISRKLKKTPRNKNKKSSSSSSSSSTRTDTHSGLTTTATTSSSASESIDTILDVIACEQRVQEKLQARRARRARAAELLLKLSRRECVLRRSVAEGWWMNAFKRRGVANAKAQHGDCIVKLLGGGDDGDMSKSVSCFRRLTMFN
jgi:hypothetical protein